MLYTIRIDQVDNCLLQQDLDTGLDNPLET